ncbi:hypothetical protein [Neptuniibacter sp. QD37_11]|uniref:hypothetical protein n=1 Tax=Neptuniibacter sp. QD37_11 TaxID=3398209 RepID=UPI0039F44DE7
MNSDFYQGINQEAFRLVICHCPPAICPESELEMTKLVATALLIGIDLALLQPLLEDGDVKNMRKLVNGHTH